MDDVKKFGPAIPSYENGDVEIYGKFGESSPSIVLGYSAETVTTTNDINSRSGNSVFNQQNSSNTTKTTVTKKIGFYNSSGQIGQPISFDSFLKAVKKATKY